MYDDIATVGADNDWIRLRKEVTGKGLITVTWVGLYNDADSWYWSLNSIPLKNQTLKMWHAGQLNNVYGKEICCTIGLLGQWWDFPAHTSNLSYATMVSKNCTFF